MKQIGYERLHTPYKFTQLGKQPVTRKVRFPFYSKHFDIAKIFDIYESIALNRPQKMLWSFYWQSSETTDKPALKRVKWKGMRDDECQKKIEKNGIVDTMHVASKSSSTHLT